MTWCGGEAIIVWYGILAGIDLMTLMKRCRRGLVSDDEQTAKYGAANYYSNGW